MQPQFSISLCSQTDPNLHQALMQAHRIFLFSTDETEEFVYFTSQQEYTPTIDPDMVLRYTVYYE